MKSQESQADLDSAGEQDVGTPVDRLDIDGKEGEDFNQANNGNMHNKYADGRRNTPRQSNQNTDMVVASNQRPNVFSSKEYESPIYDSRGQLATNVLGQSRKSIETLPLSKGGRQVDQKHSRVEDLLNRTGGPGNVTATQFSFPKNKEIVMSGQLGDSILESSSRKEGYNEAAAAHALMQTTSTEMNRFKKRNSIKRKRLGARSPYNQLYSTMKKKYNVSQESDRPSAQHIIHHRYDMSIGIKATAAAKEMVAENASRQDSKEDRSMRMTVPIDFGKNRQEDQLTNSAISVDDYNDSHRLNDHEVQTTGSLEEEAQKLALDYKQQSAGVGKLGPTVISLTHFPELTDSLGQTTLDNMFLGTPTARDRPKYPIGRLSSVNDNPAVAVLDHLASQGSDDEGYEETNYHLSKLRRLLLQAMKYSKTSQDKTWNQMTPFERAKIKKCFQELLRDMSKSERRPGIPTATYDPMAAKVEDGVPNPDLIQNLNNCLSSYPIRYYYRPRYNSPLVSINTGVLDARLNNDLILSPALANFNYHSATRFEHFIFIDDNHLKQVPVPRRICLAKDTMRNTKKSSLAGWDPARSGTFTPKFYDKKGAPKKANLSKMKDKNDSQMRKTSYPTNSRRVITKSQATDTDLDAAGNVTASKPNSAIVTKPRDGAGYQDQHQYEDDEEENYEEYNYGEMEEGFMLKSDEDVTQGREQGRNATMMRKTPIPIASDNTVAHGYYTEIISDEQQVVSSYHLNVAVGHMYNTGGPYIFGNEGFDLDGIDPQVFQHDLNIESKMIVNDLCLNSTVQSQIHKELEPEHILASNREEESKYYKSNSAMSLVNPPTHDDQYRAENGESKTEILPSPPITEVKMISEAEVKKIIRNIVTPMDLPKVIKNIKQQIPVRIKLAPPPEDPDMIVESTLQAISLTKQYQNEHEATTSPSQGKRSKKQSSQLHNNRYTPIQHRHLIVNNDINGLHVSGTASPNLLKHTEKFNSQKAYLDAIMLEKKTSGGDMTIDGADGYNMIEEKTSEGYYTSAMKDQQRSGSIKNSTYLSGAINNLNNQLSYNVSPAMSGEKTADVAVEAALSGGDKKSSHPDLDASRLKIHQNSGDFETVPNLELQARAVTKSPTHKELGQYNDYNQDTKIFPKKAALSKLASPSARDTKQMIQVESTTEKSSIYQTFMISKLGSGASDPQLQKKAHKRISGIPEQKEEVSPGKHSSRRRGLGYKQPFDGANSIGTRSPQMQKHLRETQYHLPSQKYGPTPRGKTQINRQPLRNSNNLTGWELTNHSSSRDMLHLVQSKYNQHNGAGGAVLERNGSTIDSKLQILETRMAEHNIESLVLYGTKGGAAAPKLYFSQLMTHAILRRSDLKGRSNNHDLAPFSLQVAAQNQSVIANQLAGETDSVIKLGHIYGTKKDLNTFGSKKQMYGLETQSRMTAKLADTENEEPSVKGGGGAAHYNQSSAVLPNNQKSKMLSNNSSENVFEHYRMVQIKPTVIHAEDMIDAYLSASAAKQKMHGSSVGKLLPSSPSNRIYKKGTLETSTSNPSFNIVPVHNQHSYFKHGVMGGGIHHGLSSAGNSDLKVNMLADSQQSSSKAPYKGKGTQAFAHTPSKISESDHCEPSTSLKQGQSALPSKRKPIQNVGALQKLNQTQTTGFANSGNLVAGEGDQITMVNQQTATDEVTETNYVERISMRATMQDAQGQTARATQVQRYSIMKSLADGDNETSEADSPGGVALQPQVKMPAELEQYARRISPRNFNYSLIGKKTFGNNRSYSLAPPIISQKTITGEQVIEDQEEITMPNRNRTSISPSKITGNMHKGSEHKSRKKSKATKDGETEAVFPDSQAPKQELPKMYNLNLINGGEQPLFGKKQDLRTPLDKLLTSAQMEYFQSLIGSKTYHRKQARLKGHLRNNSEYISQDTAAQTNSLMLNKSLNTTFMPGIQTQRSSGAPWSPHATAKDYMHLYTATQMSSPKQLKLPSFNQTFTVQMEGSGSISKKHTVEHVKRVKNLQAAKDNRVIFIDPMLGLVKQYHSPSGRTSQPMMSPALPKKLPPTDLYQRQKKMNATNNMVHSRKTRNSPFQATGPFSFAAGGGNTPSKQMSTSQQKPHHHASSSSHGGPDDQESNSMQYAQMPPVSYRYKSSRYRHSSDVTNTFIFNDVNKLASDLRKNSALVKPIFQSLS